ncbi:MAG TPA: hypothetical protein VKT78_00635 [Fimbriimonadaceae bacterium]|nr:hypothetical protein [Fimbriimonadaceae bacterium]
MRPAPALLVLALAGALAGCNKEKIPFLGHWDGGFEVTSSTAAAPVAAINMRGYLQLYRTGDKFLMELSNPVQVLDLGGKWKMVGSHRIELTFREYKLSEPDLVKLKGMRRPFMDPADLKNAFSKPLLLDLSQDGKSLTGLLIRIGPLLGKHVFRKGT